MTEYTYMKLYLNGLIKRDVDGGPSAAYANSPEGIARREAFERGDLRMLTLHENGSIKMIEADRATALLFIEDGWVFDDATMAWANE